MPGRVNECPAFYWTTSPLDAREMWETPFTAVVELLVRTEGKARARGAFSVAEFKTIAHRVWPEALQ